MNFGGDLVFFFVESDDLSMEDFFGGDFMFDNYDEFKIFSENEYLIIVDKWVGVFMMG